MGTDLYTQPGIEPNFNWLHTHRAPRIIGLSGYAGVGKDTTGAIIHRLYGHEPISFAAPLKEAVYRLNPIVKADAVRTVTDTSWAYARTTRLQQIVDKHGWDEAKKIGDTRELLQRFGTEVGREMFGDNFWVEQAFNQVSESGQYVFTDVRFPNEAMAILEAGGKVYRVIRPEVAKVARHVSETALDDWDFDGIIVNDQTIAVLEGEVQRVLGEFDDVRPS